MDETTQQKYDLLLNGAFPVREFMARISLLLEADPYFFPGYLEHIWIAQRDGDKKMEQDLLTNATQAVTTLFTDSHLCERVTRQWRKRDVEAVKEILSLAEISAESLFQRIRIRTQRTSIERLISTVNPDPVLTGMYLRQIPFDGFELLKQEVETLSPHWWNIDRWRSTLAYHQHTHSISLRYLVEYTQPYTPYDGVHESVPSVFITKFPALHDFVLRFAETHQLGLGRVALVRMPAWKQAYRHFDEEGYVAGRKRYHLVMQAGKNNILSCGTDTINAQEGELWFFENHVMHRAHNRSDTARIHLIFDGYPLESTVQ